MQFDIPKLESMGITVELNRDKDKITIAGDMPLAEETIEAFRTMETAITAIPGIKGFEASRLVETFCQDVIDTGILNLLKQCQDR